MSERILLEPPTENTQSRRASDAYPPIQKRQPPVVAPSIDTAHAQLLVKQGWVLVGIAFVTFCIVILFLLRMMSPVTQPVSAPIVAAAPAPVAVVTQAPIVTPPVVATPSPVKPAAAPVVATLKPVAPTPVPPVVHHTVPAAPKTPIAATTHHHKAVAVATPKPVVAPATPAPQTPVTAKEPIVLQPSVIDTVDYNGPIIHMAWKSLGKDVTYKVYVSPNVHQLTFQFRFNKYGTSLDWFMNENKSWRYVAISMVDASGKESALSNIIDTTPGEPKP